MIRSSSARTGPFGDGVDGDAVGGGAGVRGSPSTTIGLPWWPGRSPNWAVPVVTSTVAAPARARPASARRRTVRFARRMASAAGSAASGPGAATRRANVSRSARSSSSCVTANGRSGPSVWLSQGFGVRLIGSPPGRWRAARRPDAGPGRPAGPR
ncbi:hypothetical protein, partial [Micromonospora sp. ATA51]|uniref:hypothetical protein n=1 Tax=Micromonospora sp. ATA51 TaxID=2806098 RepID=UPI001EE45456